MPIPGKVRIGGASAEEINRHINGPLDGATPTVKERKVADRLSGTERPSLKDRAERAAAMVKYLEDMKTLEFVGEGGMGQHGCVAFQKSRGDYTELFAPDSREELEDFVKRLNEIITPWKEKKIKDMEHKIEKVLHGEYRKEEGRETEFTDE